MIDLQTHAEGFVIPVRAQPGGKRNGVVGEFNGQLKVSVTEAAEKGNANRALIKVLRQVLGVKRTQITLLSGAASRDKRFLIRGIDAPALRRTIEGLL